MILILGGNGGVVNTIVKHLSKPFIVAGRNIPRVLPEHAAFIQCDFSKKADIKVLVQKLEPFNVEAIIHCIAGNYNLKDMGTGSVLITQNIAEFFNHKKIIYISTIKVCQASFSSNKTDHNLPYSQYAWIKLLTEQIVKSSFKKHIILRIGFLISPYSKKYYKPQFVMNLLFSKYTFGFKLRVKCLTEEDLIKSINTSLCDTNLNKTTDIWSYFDYICNINKHFYPDYIWIKAPRFIAKKYVNFLYNLPMKKFVDYFHFYE